MSVEQPKKKRGRRKKGRHHLRTQSTSSVVANGPFTSPGALHLSSVRSVGSTVFFRSFDLAGFAGLDVFFLIGFHGFDRVVPGLKFFSGF